MSYVVLEKKIKTLPESALNEVSAFVDFLFYKDNCSTNQIKPDSKKKGFGCLKDISCHMSDDFDAPLDVFKEYM